MLAHYAKPVALDGARERRYVRLEAQPAADSVAPIVRHQLELRARGSDPGAPLGTFLQERYGPEVDGLAVSCADGAFTLIAHAGAIIQAQRDYVLARPHGCGFNWLGRADTRTPESQEPALAGAVASVTFGGGGWFWLIRLPKWLERPVTRWIRSGAAMLAA
jgi:hypothetical protein